MKQFSVPAGMRDLILGECETKKELQLQIEDCLNKWGYEEIITPTIEFYKTYDVGFDNMQEEDMYKFFDANGRILMLRADMTIPIARVVATKFKDAQTPLRFRYCANVFKVHEELSGLQNEISDCGVELIGMEESCAELEILVTAMEALNVVKDKKIVLEIGNINFFREACRALNFEEETILTLAKLIDDKSLKSLEDYVKTLNVSTQDQQFFMQLPWLNGNERILEVAKQYAFNDALIEIVDRLQTLNTQLKALGYDEINFDLGKVSNLNYYTGLIFEAYVEGVGSRVLSGGSYNTLIAKYGSDLSAIGFSIKLDALLEVVKKEERKAYCAIEYPKHLLVEAMKQSKQLRKDKVVKLKVNDALTQIVIKEVA
ncbi:MAG: ATP phosphoribosyltransferase regulatory subunit [Erysipelotrichia bacterium]|nr:ATP phosphoribosyltransferase regulatory subunit [Erysipelotrichia bacterium]NCC54320.1 ATP phosphoribosyltransferase regulatory subunit [Erysipelotrichia bacterium]